MVKDIASTEIVPVKLPIITTIFGCYNLLVDKIKHFVVIGSIFAGIMMLLYITNGQNALCINNGYRIGHFCTNNWIWFVVTHFVGLFVLCMFARIWCQKSLLGNATNWKKDLLPQKSDLKILGLVMIYIGAIAVAVLSGYALYQRVPNPDWRIELGYFAVVSLGFLVPLFSLRFLSYFAYVAEEVSLPSMKVVWKKTKGNMFSILLFVTFLMLVGVFASQNLLNYYTKVSVDASFFVMLISEYLSDIAVLFIVACFTNYCYQQKTFLSEGN